MENKSQKDRLEVVVDMLNQDWDCINKFIKDTESVLMQACIECEMKISNCVWIGIGKVPVSPKVTSRRFYLRRTTENDEITPIFRPLIECPASVRLSVYKHIPTFRDFVAQKVAEILEKE
jgi:hypothetical protein